MFELSPRIQKGGEGILDGASKEESDIHGRHRRHGRPQAKDFSWSPIPTYKPTHPDPATKGCHELDPGEKKLGAATTLNQKQERDAAHA